MFTRGAPRGYEQAAWDGCSPRLQRALRQVVRERRWPLLIHGQTGCGKTCAAVVLYRSMVAGAVPLWHRADDLLSRMTIGKAGEVSLEVHGDYGPEWRTMRFAAAMRRLSSCRGLFLDDLGTFPPTASMVSMLFDILESRLGQTLVITSNHTPDHLGELYGDRILSRLRAGTILLVTGDDRRDGQGLAIKV